MVEVNVGIVSVPRLIDSALTVFRQEKVVARTLLLNWPLLPLCQSKMPPLHCSTIRLWLLPLHHPLQTHSLFIHCRTMSPLGLVVPLPTCIPQIVPTRVLHCHLCRLQLCWLTRHLFGGHSMLIGSCILLRVLTLKWYIGGRTPSLFPSNSGGKKFVFELSALYRAYAELRAMDCIAPKAITVISILLLQKPHCKSKLKDHSVCLEWRLQFCLRVT